MKVPLVEFMCIVFTRMPGESYRRRLRSLLVYWCDVFRELINSLVCRLPLNGGRPVNTLSRCRGVGSSSVRFKHTCVVVKRKKERKKGCLTFELKYNISDIDGGVSEMWMW